MLNTALLYVFIASIVKWILDYRVEVENKNNTIGNSMKEHGALAVYTLSIVAWPITVICLIVIKLIPYLFNVLTDYLGVSSITEFYESIWQRIW